MRVECLELSDTSAYDLHSFLVTLESPRAVAIAPEQHNATSSSSGKLVHKRLDDSCSQEITPTCIQQLYGIPAGNNAGSGQSSLAVGGFIGENLVGHGSIPDAASYLRPIC